MKINEDRDTSSIDPKVDKYINNLFVEVKKQNLDNRSANIFNYVIYLLLNNDFQYILRSFRLCLGIPIDGFQNDKEVTLWKAEFREIVDKFHQNLPISAGTKFLLTQVEKTLKRQLLDNNQKELLHVVFDISSDAINTACGYILRFLGLRNTKNVVYWLVILKELFLLNSPEKVTYHLKRWSTVFGSQSIRIRHEGEKGTILAITLYPDTTIKDIERVIDKKRKMISEEIKKLKTYVRDNESKADDIERDYFIYKTYTSHRSTRKRNEHISENIRKEDMVANTAEETLTRSKQKTVINMEWESMRKVVSRMNKRIDRTLPMDKAEIDDWLKSINA